MNVTQRKSAAKFLYDLAKVVFAVAMAGNVFSERPFRFLSLSVGIIVISASFGFAHFLEREVKDGNDRG